jgi:hypothetical protein
MCNVCLVYCRTSFFYCDPSLARRKVRSVGEMKLCEEKNRLEERNKKV